MKRKGWILMLLCVTVGVCAQNHRQVNLNKAMLQLWREGKPLQALDSAVTLLTLNENHNGAKYFVYQHWEEAMRMTNERLQQVLRMDELEQVTERVEIFRMLDEVHERVTQVEMPIRGLGWTWQPPVEYYSGHYDSERSEAFRVALRRADEAMQSYDVEGGKYCYELAMTRFLLTEGERKSNWARIKEKEIARLQDLVQAKHLHKATFAYELADYLLTLDADNEEVKALQQQAKEAIVAAYMQMAEEAFQNGDTLQANDYRLSAADWK